MDKPWPPAGEPHILRHTIRFILFVLNLLYAGFCYAQPRPQQGPWNHDLILTESSDGLNFRSEKKFIERSGVPSLIRDIRGQLIAAFQWFPFDNQASFDQVAVMTSSDEGKTWSRQQTIQVRDLPTDYMRPFDPTLVLLEDGRIRLYFTSHTQQNRTPAIYSAISSDAVHYTFEQGVRFGVEGETVIDCAVARLGRHWHLYAPVQRQPGSGYHAISEDGLKFQRLENVSIGGDREWLGCAVATRDGLRFYGSGKNGIWSAVSKDGSKWQLEEGSRGENMDPGVVAINGGRWLMVGTGPPRADVGPPPFPSGKIPFAGQRPELFERIRNILTHIPSTAGGKEGIAVRVLVPQTPRYKDGAPVAIHVAGGVQAGAAAGRPEFVELGFLEVFFAFPGGGQGEERSGGSYDFRGPHCIRALADIIRFATGRVADKQGRNIDQLAQDITVIKKNCGIIGYSHGGNACGLAMALFGQEFPDLAFYASMESPYGEGAANVELGGLETGVNPAYNPVTEVLNLSTLAWSPELAPGLAGRKMPAATKLQGALFFDLNGDTRFSPNEDFPANCFIGDVGGGIKAWYSPRLLAEAKRRSLFGPRRPEHIPTLAESQEFWRYRDAADSIAEAIRKCTNVAVIIYAGQHDHVQAAPDHPHILTQVEGFRKAGARFVRLNPDRAYVERLLADGQPRQVGVNRFGKPFCDNDASSPYNRDNIRDHLEPEGPPITLFMQAAVCELADRVQSKNWSKNLPAVLYADTP